MKRQHLPALFATSVFALANTQIAQAHFDHDKPRFVATTGIDAGRCESAARPCASIAYAASQANKGDKILVAGGSYSLNKADDLFYIASGLISIETGFSRYDHYSLSDTALNPVTLSGVPAEFRSDIEALGFSVIADGKSMTSAQLQQSQKMLGAVDAMRIPKAAADCVNGQADSLSCDQVGLVSHTPLGSFSSNPTRANDIWGFVDMNTQREYVLLGLNNAVAVVDISNPEAPVEIASFSGQSTTWRDIKVLQRYDAASERYQAYAYVTADNVNDRLQIIDLSGLPNSANLAATTGDFQAAHNVYLSNADYETGLANGSAPPRLQIAGANLSNGVFRSYDLSNPLAPALLSAAGTGYIHDATSLTITDSRKDTQCVASGDACELLADFNESTIDIWDITNGASPSRLSSTPYTNSAYTHSGWWTEDRRYLYVHDELDEQQRGLNTTVRVFNLDNLAAPTLSGVWTGPTGAIDHNGFVRGNRYYMSNYTRGLTVLDISDPANPVDVGFIDTFAHSDSNAFSGAWGVYPFFPSGTLAISDIDSGLYLADDSSRNGPAGTVSFLAASTGATEGNTLTLNVERSGGTQGAVSVDYELVLASVASDDLATNSGTLSWNDGEAGAKPLSISTINDGNAEGIETALVRLTNPANGLSLGAITTANAYVSDPGDASVVQFLDTDLSFTEADQQWVVVVQRLGSAIGAVSVDVSVAGTATSGDDFTSSVPTSLSWDDGDARPQSLVFKVTADTTSEPDETISITLNNPTGASVGNASSATLTIVNDDNAPAPPPPPVTPPGGGSSGGSSGGGALGGIALLLFAAVSIRRRRAA
ncbi:MAG: choice-of-anchor B family protein [Pseudomonadota bacterium]